jgi:TIR domain-containing protein
MAAKISANGGDAGDAARPGDRRREAIRTAARRRPIKARGEASLTELHENRRMATTREPQSIFVSYSHADIRVVRALVSSLRKRGARVTWDEDFVGGTDFERAIRDAIDSARSVIVVWSPMSVTSPYVRDEARRALSKSKLITTHVAGLDFADVPFGFGNLHCVPVDDQELVRKSLAEHGIFLRG